jgi:Flp pilus assembly protein TadD
LSNLDSSQLELVGLNAYRNGEYEEAVAALKALTLQNPAMWNCRLYLGMSYTKLGRISHAIQEFRDISEWCPDKDLRDKASAALRAMNHISNGSMDSLSKHKGS